MRVERIGEATLYHGDCYDLLDKLAVADALVTDQPYGIKYEVNARSWGNEGLTALKPYAMEKRAAIKGDDKPFDPRPFLAFPKIALFGANHCAHALPRSGRWIVWDKRSSLTAKVPFSKPDDHSDCELIWTNVEGADRIHRQKWRGIVREGEENCSRSKKLHPNQKPVALMGYVLEQLKLQPGALVCDPFMGSGSTGIAAIRAGYSFIGVEHDDEHFATAVQRFQAEAAAITPNR